MASRRKPKLGDLVEIVWEDIAGGEHGEPECPVFRTIGYWHGIVEQGGRKYIITTRSKIEKGGSGYCTGWDSFPEPVVLEVCVL